MSEHEHSENERLIAAITKHTGYNCEIRDGEIILKPDLCTKIFFKNLFTALTDFSHGFMVNRNLEVIISKEAL